MAAVVRLASRAHDANCPLATSSDDRGVRFLSLAAPPVFEQRPDGTRQGMAVGEAMKELRGRKARSLRLVAIQEAPILPGAKMTAVMVARMR